MPRAHDRVSRPLRALTATIVAALLVGVVAATAAAAATTTSASATGPGAAVDSSSAKPIVALSPTGSGRGETTTIAVDVEACPAGSIKITNTVDNGSQRIARNGAPATVVSHGTPGSFSIKATCSNGAHASAPFVVTKARGPSVTLRPSFTGPVPKTVHVEVQGCPPGTIKITDSINGGSQTITKNRVPATIPSPGTPGKYHVTATCAADGAGAHAGFVVKRGGGPTVSLHPASTGTVTKTVGVVVSGCPAGKIKITDTINGGSQTIKHDKAPATIVSQGNPGTYEVTARCSDGAKAHAQFVVTPDGPIQTGGGSTFSRGEGPRWMTWTGIAMLALGIAGGLALVVRRERDRRR